jgi:hypothetical protein
VISHQKHYFVKHHSDSAHKYSEDEIKKMLEFLIDNIYVVVGGQVFQESVGIPMGTNCAPMLADLFLYSYEAEVIQKLLHEKKNSLAVSFNSIFRYIDDVLSISNNQFHSELGINDISQCSTSASYLDMLLKLDINGKVTAQLYDKRDDFKISIVNFPYLCSNIPASLEYSVYISQLNRYARGCSTYDQFLVRGSLLTNKLMSQGFQQSRLRAAFRKFYGQYNGLIYPYNLFWGHVLFDMFHIDR